MRTFLIAVSVVVLCTGCSSAPKIDLTQSVVGNLEQKEIQRIGSRVSYDSRNQRFERAGGSAVSNAEAEGIQIDVKQAYTEVLLKCNVLLTQYERKADDAKWMLLGLATAGGVAGSIVVPTLLARASVAKSVVAGWSGLSGATNFAQHAIVNVALDPNFYVTTRAGVVAKVQQGISDFASAQGDYNKQFAALASIEGACVAYGIAAAPQQVNETAPPVSIPSQPKDVSVEEKTASLAVTFVKPASDGGAAITEYVAIATPKTDGTPGRQAGAASPLTITGLTGGKQYEVSVVARNAAGQSQPGYAPAPATPK